jgi:hypothetical protein
LPKADLEVLDGFGAAILECGESSPLWYFGFLQKENSKAAMTRRAPKQWRQ